EQSVAGRDIGEIPPVTDPARRDSCRRDFRLFCETYFSAVFALAWSPDHLKVISIIENSVLEGGLFAVAMPRGSGKTSLATCAADFVLIDDPQTDESANSPQQVRKRLNTVNGAILGLAGPKKKIAGVMPITVIAKGDMADQVLDRKTHPEWQGQRIKLMPKM